MALIPIEEFKTGQAVKIFDSFEDSYWDPLDIDDWDEDDDNIFGILGLTLTIKTINGDWMRAVTDTGREFEIHRRDVEYIIGGFGDIPDFNPPDVSSLSGLLFA